MTYELNFILCLIKIRESFRQEVLLRLVNFHVRIIINSVYFVIAGVVAPNAAPENQVLYYVDHADY